MRRIFKLENKNFTDLNPLQLGIEEFKNEQVSVLEIRDYYTIYYIAAGKGVFQTESAEYSLNSGDLFLVKPYQAVSSAADFEEPWTQIWISFSSSLELEGIFENSIISLPESAELFHDLLECERYGEAATLFVCGKLYEIIALLKKECPQTQDQFERYALIAKNYMDTNYAREISVEAVADYLRIDRCYFSVIFKNKTGKSPREYLIDLRLSKAADLMRKKKYGPSMAAKLCGYPDLYHFSKIFKKKYGVAPREYFNNETNKKQ